jgi:D-alanine-D-alanine ligase
MKLRVGVLMGGRSIEREVSFNSGRTICDHLDVTKFSIVPVFQSSNGKLYLLPPHFIHRGKISDFSHRLATEATEIAWDDLKSHIDFAYLALHGRYAEDGTIQGMLELLQIPYLGTKLFGSALSMDKIMQKKFLRAAGIAVARDIIVQPSQINEDSITHLIAQMQQQGFGFPCIIKPYKEGSSLGMSVVFEESQFLPALKAASFATPGIQQAILVEEKLTGMEFTCIVMTDYKTGKPIFLPPTEIVTEAGSHFFTYEQKYMPGRATKYTPARCSSELLEKIQQTCLHVMQLLNFTNIGRIDGFLTPDGTVYIIDPNSLTGMGPTSHFFRQAAAIGMSHRQVINHLIETELASSYK